MNCNNRSFVTGFLILSHTAKKKKMNCIKMNGAQCIAKDTDLLTLDSDVLILTNQSRLKVD